MRRDTTDRPWGRAAIGGGIAGLIAGIVMAMWTMFATGTYLDLGVFSPMYAIVATLIGRETLQASIQDGTWYWEAGPAMLGAAIHMMNSIVLGVIFGLLTAAFSLRGAAAFTWGIVYALIVMFVMNAIVVPVTDSVQMGRSLGWPTWTISHLLFGAVLGLWPALRRGDVAAVAEPGDEVRTPHRRAA